VTCEKKERDTPDGLRDAVSKKKKKRARRKKIETIHIASLRNSLKMLYLNRE
jgi:hypothetical protein